MFNKKVNYLGVECTYWLNGKLNSGRKLPEIGDDLL